MQDGFPELPEFLKREKPTNRQRGDFRDADNRPKAGANDDTRPRLFLERKISGHRITPGWHPYEIRSVGPKWADVLISGKPVKMRRKAWDAITTKG